MDALDKLSHHAYCCVNVDSEEIFVLLGETHMISTRGNPDFFYERYDVFGIDESRYIKELHAAKAFTSGGKRIFILEFNGITHEAQNALLKIFEEPHEHTHFFLLISNASVLLPTLRSRLLIIEGEKGEHRGLIEAKEFMKLPVKEKIIFVDDLSGKISDEKLEKADALQFLAALEIILSDDPEKYQKPLAAILKVRDYMNDRAASIKQLLEFVALSF